MSKTPEIAEIERSAQAANVDLAAVLKRAGVASTTWWRWTEGHFDPRLSTLRKVREALAAAIAEKAADVAPSQEAAA